ncbi:hypothetical protein [Mycolicibacterium sediminis]|uniref:Uncharacterized protein n=1 Tax=Mycolicibacterium sediminis TaxID=1286180 RepID=A0A7I7QJV1_9MYCO|nr:hypothetical protein [Mycolicibacterium sediminis]BBY26581.1 hypothetical protein MSEDJ_06770 [Mycolicibacterium sediminis]
MAGSSASLAFAKPDQGPSGDGGGSGSGSAAGSGTGVPTGVASDETTTVTFPGPLIGTGRAPWSITRPTSTVGNGRTGLESDGTATQINSAPTGKAPEEASQTPEQIVDEVPGELQPGVPASGTAGGSGAAGAAETGGAAPSAPADPVAEQPTPESAGGNATDPDRSGTPQAAGGGRDADDPSESWWGFVPDLLGAAAGAEVEPAGPEPFNPPQTVPMQVPPLSATPLPIRQTGFAPVFPYIGGITDSILEAVTGFATAASKLPIIPITLPVFDLPINGGVGAVAGTSRHTSTGADGPVLPRVDAPVSSRPEIAPGVELPDVMTAPAEVETVSPPATLLSNELLPAPTYRMGYVDYLKAAGLGEVAAVAVPGVTGILILTSAGGLIGYRQARAGRAVRAGGTARFMG